MTELTDLNDTDALNTAVTGQSTEGNTANMGGMDNLFQATLGMLSRFRNSNIFRLRDNTDKTKLLAFDLSGLTPGTTRTATFPDGNGTVMYTNTTLANAQALTGSIVQTASNFFTARAVSTTVIPYDNTVPQSTEGDNLLGAGINPLSTTNKIRCKVVVSGTSDGVRNVIAALFVGTGSVGANAVATGVFTTPGTDYFGSTVFEYEYVPGTTSGQSIAVRVGPASGTFYINGSSTGDLFGGSALRCSLIVEEIKA